MHSKILLARLRQILLRRTTVVNKPYVFDHNSFTHMSPVRELPPSAEKEILYMKTATPKENAQTNYTQLPIDKIVVFKRTTKVPVKRRRITREMVLEDAFTYQIPMEVTQIMKRLNGDC